MSKSAIDGTPQRFLTAVYAYRDPKEVAHVFDSQKAVLNGGTDCGVVSISRQDEIGRLELIEHVVNAARGQFCDIDRVRLIDEILSTATPTAAWYNTNVHTLWDSPEMAIAITEDQLQLMFTDLVSIAAAHYGDNPEAIRAATTKIVGTLSCHTETNDDHFADAMKTLCQDLSIPDNTITPLGDCIANLLSKDTASRQSLMRSFATIFTMGVILPISLVETADEEAAHV